MKNLLLGLLAFASISSFASSDCSVQIPEGYFTEMNKILESKGFNITFNEGARFKFNAGLDETYDGHSLTLHLREKLADGRIGFVVAQDFRASNATLLIFNPNGSGMKSKHRAYKKALEYLESTDFTCENFNYDMILDTGRIDW